MAKKEITLVEKLEEAIVKDAPYKVPENWVWLQIGKCIDIRRGASPRPINKFITEDENGINWIRIGDTNNSRFLTSTEQKITLEGAKKSVYLKAGTLILSNSMSFGRPYILKIDGCIHDGWLALSNYETLFDVNYLYFGLLSSEWYFEQVAVGSGVRNLNIDRVSKLPIPLPPFKEQQRIVDRIESLFEKLDKAKELIEEARDGFDKRMAVILEKAFRGELTEKWRVVNSVEYDLTWSFKLFDDIAKVKSNLVEPSDFFKYPHIAPDNIEKRTGRLLEYRTIEEDKVKSAKHKFSPGQILYSKIRPNLSKVVLIDFEGLCSADMYPIETELFTKYLYYYMLSDTFVDYASNAGSRSVLPKINQKELGRIVVPVCSMEEQKEIVRILDRLLEDEFKLEELTQLGEQIELIKISILARAFRGELGTNCEEDESALELLKTILNN